jgi:hypothetical protein
MKRTARYALLLTVALSLLAGCGSPAPVELVDREVGTPGVELLNEPVAPPMLGMDDVDSNGQFPVERRNAFAQLLIAGSVYDGLFVHTESALARGIFFDRSKPVLNLLGDTVAYSTVDVGALTIDGDELRKHPKFFAMDVPQVDTLLGPQYSLKSGTAAGLAFDGDRTYRWQNASATLPESIDVSVRTPAALVVTQPLPAYRVRLSRNLPVRWRGGAAEVKIVISDVVGAGRPKPLVRLRVRTNIGSAVIPSAILEMLPAGRAGFLFTFSSERSSMVRIAGYADDVLVQATTSHSIYLQCSP